MTDDDLDTEQPPEELATIDLGDPVSVKRKRDRHTHDREEEDQFWRTVLTHRTGRRALYRLLTHAHTFETRFVATPSTSGGGGAFPDPYATWFHAGQQDYGQFLLLSWMKLDIEAVNLMLQENDSRFAKPKARKLAVP